MTYTELQKKITHLETELTEVKEMADAMKKRVDGGVFKPENGQGYWFISASGDAREDGWDDYSIDHAHYSIGNCFPTKQAAENAIRVLKLTQKARETQNGFVPDWGDSTQHKYTLHFENNEIWVGSNFLMNTAPTLGYWEDESACEQFIDENREDLIWFFTEYER